jgi:hypothetical protein
MDTYKGLATAGQTYTRPSPNQPPPRLTAEKIEQMLLLAKLGKSLISGLVGPAPYPPSDAPAMPSQGHPMDIDTPSGYAGYGEDSREERADATYSATTFAHATPASVATSTAPPQSSRRVTGGGSSQQASQANKSSVAVVCSLSTPFCIGLDASPCRILTRDVSGVVRRPHRSGEKDPKVRILLPLPVL